MKNKITCPSCKYVCCNACFKRFLEGKTITNLICMNCREEFPLSCKLDFFTKKFINTFRNQKTINNILPLEKGLIAETQKKLMDAQNVYVKKGVMDSYIKTLRDKHLEEIANLKASYELQVKCIQNGTTEIPADFVEEFKTYYLKDFRENAYRLNLDMILNEEETATYTSKIKCPNEKCCGFIYDNDNGDCSLCQTSVCLKCKEIENVNHKCDPNIIENLKLIEKDTKNCPGCDTPIHKIDGCNQMWCPTCHTAFSWNTGEIETGKIHNPHYYEWVRQNNGGVIPRDIDDNGLPPFREIHTMMQRDWNTLKRTKRQDPIPNICLFILQSFYRTIYHNRGHVIPELNNNPRIVNYKRKMRIAYINDDITEEKWIKKLEYIAKVEEIFKTMCPIYIDYTESLTSIFKMYYDRFITLIELHNNIMFLVKETNNKLLLIKKLYGRNALLISDKGESTIVYNFSIVTSL